MVARRLALEKRRDHPRESFKGARVTKERGHGDEQVCKERLNLLDVLAEELQVVFKPLHAVHLHPPGQTPQYGRSLVLGEVMTGARSQVAQQTTQGVLASSGQVLDAQMLLAAEQWLKLRSDFSNG